MESTKANHFERGYVCPTVIKVSYTNTTTSVSYQAIKKGVKCNKQVHINASCAAAALNILYFFDCIELSRE
jgi:hypothetical protein